MNTRLLMATFGFSCIAAVAAQTRPAGDALPPVQPPPEMDEPAGKAVIPDNPSMPVIPLANSDEEARAAAAAEAKANAERAKTLGAPPTLPATTPAPGTQLNSPGLPPDVQKAAEATELPVITVRQNGNERVEEYRKHGVLYFVRVVEPEGPPRYYVDRRTDIPPDLHQLTAPSGVIDPVYFKLAEWK